MPAPARLPRTQQQRRDETRRAILDAAVSSLTELGFARTTTLEVQRRADVSRGALLHHFPSKAGLLAATIEHLAEMRGRELRALEVKLPGGRARAGAAIDLLWESFSGPLFHVAMDLRAAARTDDELRDALAVAEKIVHERIKQQCRALFGAEIGAQPGFECALEITLQLMIGAGMTATLHGEEQTRIELLIEEWKTLFPTLLQANEVPKRRTR